MTDEVPWWLAEDQEEWLDLWYQPWDELLLPEEDGEAEAAAQSSLPRSYDRERGSRLRFPLRGGRRLTQTAHNAGVDGGILYADHRLLAIAKPPGPSLATRRSEPEAALARPLAALPDAAEGRYGCCWAGTSLAKPRAAGVVGAGCVGLVTRGARCTGSPGVAVTRR